MNELVDQQKRKQLQAMLDTGRGLVMLHLDPRHDGVSVPPQFSGDPVLRLSLAYGFKLPALDVGREGVYAVLSFSGRPFGCTLPWGAIFAMTSPDEGHEGVVWPDDLPPELRPFFEQAGLRNGSVPVSLEPVVGAAAPPSEDRGEEPIASLTSRSATPRPPTRTRPRRLSMVGDEAASSDEEPSPPPADAPPPQRPRLTLVKG